MSQAFDRMTFSLSRLDFFGARAPPLPVDQTSISGFG
jgi:hypothetical protein